VASVLRLLRTALPAERCLGRTARGRECSKRAGRGRGPAEGQGTGGEHRAGWRRRPSRPPEQQTPRQPTESQGAEPRELLDPTDARLRTPTSQPLSPHPALPLAQRHPSGHSIPPSTPVICIPDLCSDFRCRRPASGPTLTAWAHTIRFTCQSRKGGPPHRGGPPFLESPGLELNRGRRRGCGVLPSKNQQAEINAQISTASGWALHRQVRRRGEGESLAG
jgi:hypothetical protein